MYRSSVSIQVALVVPCFNEADRFDCEYWSQVGSIECVELLFVDDGSSDATTQVLAEFTAGNDRFRMLPLNQNVGKAEAVRLGLRQILSDGSAQLVGFADADTSIPAVEFERLLDLAQEKILNGNAESLWASRVALAGRGIKRSFFRHAVGRTIANLVGIGEPPLPYDTQCGFKVFDPAESFISACSNGFTTRWFVDLEIFFRLRERMGRPPIIWEEPVQGWSESSGSHLGLRSFPQVARDLIVLKLGSVKHRSRPSA